MTFETLNRQLRGRSQHGPLTSGYTYWTGLRVERLVGTRAIRVRLLAGGLDATRGADRHSSSDEIKGDARDDVEQKDPDLVERDPGYVHRIE